MLANTMNREQARSYGSMNPQRANGPRGPLRTLARAAGTAAPMADLFGTPRPAAPLAEAMRPQSLADVVGQPHLLGPGKPLRQAFESGKPHSMILWWSPGVGKTTLARLMANAFNAEFIALSAAFSGVKDIREAVQRA